MGKEGWSAGWGKASIPPMSLRRHKEILSLGRSTSLLSPSGAVLRSPTAVHSHRPRSRRRSGPVSHSQRQYRSVSPARVHGHRPVHHRRRQERSVLGPWDSSFDAAFRDGDRLLAEAGFDDDEEDLSPSTPSVTDSEDDAGGRQMRQVRRAGFPSPYPPPPPGPPPPSALTLDPTVEDDEVDPPPPSTSPPARSSAGFGAAPVVRELTFTPTPAAAATAAAAGAATAAAEGGRVTEEDGVVVVDGDAFFDTKQDELNITGPLSPRSEVFQAVGEAFEPPTYARAFELVSSPPPPPPSPPSSHLATPGSTRRRATVGGRHTARRRQQRQQRLQKEAVAVLKRQLCEAREALVRARRTTQAQLAAQRRDFEAQAQVWDVEREALHDEIARLRQTVAAVSMSSSRRGKSSSTTVRRRRR